MPELPIKKINVFRDKNFVYFHRLVDEEPLVRYDLKTKQMQKLRIRNYVSKYKKDIREWSNVETQYDFFRGYRVADLIFTEDKFKKLIDMSTKMNGSCSSLSSFISRLNNALVYENYIAQKINYTVSRQYRSYYSPRSTYVHFQHPLEDYNKNTIKFFKDSNFNVTTQFENAYFRTPLFWDNIIIQLNALDITNQQIGNSLLSLINKEDDILQLINQYNYSTKSLLRYLINYLQPFENLALSEGIRLLKDYYRMASMIGRDIKKYPKYLKSIHDIIAANYNAFKKEYDLKKFMSIINPELEHIDKKYRIVNPKNPKDILIEGTQLNHCVSSYVNMIINKQTYIFFLRLKDEPDKSLVTLELRSNKIVQAKGHSNRPLTQPELTFLEKYCKMKKFELGESL